MDDDGVLGSLADTILKGKRFGFDPLAIRRQEFLSQSVEGLLSWHLGIWPKGPAASSARPRNA